MCLTCLLVPAVVAAVPFCGCGGGGGGGVIILMAATSCFVVGTRNSVVGIFIVFEGCPALGCQAV